MRFVVTAKNIRSLSVKYEVAFNKSCVLHVTLDGASTKFALCSIMCIVKVNERQRNYDS